MDYGEILSTSDAIRRIPDSWFQQIPFLMEYKGRQWIAFLYAEQVSQNSAEVRQLILIDREDGAVAEVFEEELLSAFPSLLPIFYLPTIEDYAAYFDSKDRYDDMFSASLKAPPESEIAAMCEALFRDIVSEESYARFFSVLSIRKELIER